jgi:hypothetical protein
MAHAPTTHFRKSLVGRLVQLACATAAVATAGPLHAQQLIAPDAPVAGVSQSYLQAAFIQWLVQYPEETNPFITGTNLQAGDQGDYFFLPGSPSEDPVFRSVTVRQDQVLLLDLQIAASVIFPGSGLTEADIRQEASDVIGVASNLSVTVNGAPALMPAGYTSLDEFRLTSPLFPLALMEGSIFGAPAGIYPAVTDGFQIALAGLPAGNHTVRFTSFIDSSVFGFTAAQDITYNITSVVPEVGTWAMMSLGLLAIAGFAQRRRAGSTRTDAI